MPLFINGAIINNIFLKTGYTTKKSDLWSSDFTQKCSQNVGNAISETLNSKIFWQRIPLDPPTYVISITIFITVCPLILRKRCLEIKKGGMNSNSAAHSTNNEVDTNEEQRLHRLWQLLLEF